MVSRGAGDVRQMRRRSTERRLTRARLCVQVMTRAAAAAMAQRLQAPPAAQAVSQVRRAAWLRRHKAGYAEALEQLQQ